MLYFENVSTFYGKIQALHDVNVEVRQGEIVTLIGANGAGKSTLLMTLCGSPQASSGSIRYQGEELIGQDTPSIMRKSIAVVPEGRRVFSRLTVEENLVMGISNRIFVVSQGTPLAHGKPDEIRNNPAVIKAYLGES